MPFTDILPVLLAGGESRRLWPLGAYSPPKPYHALVHPHRSPFQQTALRCAEIADTHDLLAVCRLQDATLAQRQIHSAIPQARLRILAEPCPRNTAAACITAALYCREIKCDPLLLITPTDHAILHPYFLHTAVRHSLKAAREGMIVTFGIAPEGPCPQMGYILPKHAGHDPVHNTHDPAHDPIPVSEFIEKPNRTAAEQLIVQQGALWNSGIFLVAASVLIAEAQRYTPEIYDGCIAALQIAAAQHVAGAHSLPWELPPEAYRCIPSLAIDRAVMERSQKLTVQPVACGWSDIGTWERLYSNREFLQAV